VQKLRKMIKQKHKEELRELISSRLIKNVDIKKKSNKGNLVGLVERRTALYRKYKGKEYKAMLTPSGMVICRGKTFKSASAAALSIVDGKSANGWYFWRIKKPSGEWVRLADY
jgi:hypothetical protein